VAELQKTSPLFIAKKAVYSLKIKHIQPSSCNCLYFEGYKQQ